MVVGWAASLETPRANQNVRKVTQFEKKVGRNIGAKVNTLFLYQLDRVNMSWLNIFSLKMCYNVFTYIHLNIRIKMFGLGNIL